MEKCSPIGGDNGVAADVDAFGFGLAAHFGKRRLVLLLLEDTTHSVLFGTLFFSLNCATMCFFCLSDFSRNTNGFVRVVAF